MSNNPEYDLLEMIESGVEPSMLFDIIEMSGDMGWIEIIQSDISSHEYISSYCHLKCIPAFWSFAINNLEIYEMDIYAYLCSLEFSEKAIEKISRDISEGREFVETISFFASDEGFTVYFDEFYLRPEGEIISHDLIEIAAGTSSKATISKNKRRVGSSAASFYSRKW